MRALNAEEMESFSKIYLRDVSRWMSIKDACIPNASIITKLLKKQCISLIARGSPSHATCKHD
jgi:hypothetical protein